MNTRKLERQAENLVPSLSYDMPYKKRYDRLTLVGQSSVAENNYDRKLPASLFAIQDLPQQTSRGLCISIPLKLSEDPKFPSMAWIYCFLEGRPVCIFIDQPKSSANLYARQRSSWLVTVAPEQLEEFQVTKIYIHSNGVIESSDTHSAKSEQVLGRIKLVHEDNQEYTATPISVYPARHWNLDELFYTGQPNLFGAILFECVCETSTFDFAVVIGQHKGAPWCKVYSRGSILKNEGSFGRTKFLDDLVAEMSSWESFVDLSDRSMIMLSNGVVFSAAIRQRPSPNSMITLYTLRTSSCSTHG